MENILAANILYYGGVRGLSLLSVKMDGLEISDFEVETANTVFESSPVALLKEGVIDEFLLDDIAWIYRNNERKAALKKLDDLFRSSSLYASAGETAALLIIGEDCRVVFVSRIGG